MKPDMMLVHRCMMSVCAARVLAQRQSPVILPRPTAAACLVATTTVLQMTVSAGPGSLDPPADYAQHVSLASTKTLLVLDRACHAPQERLQTSLGPRQ